MGLEKENGTTKKENIKLKKEINKMHRDYVTLMEQFAEAEAECMWRSCGHFKDDRKIRGPKQGWKLTMNGFLNTSEKRDDDEDQYAPTALCEQRFRAFVDKELCKLDLHYRIPESDKDLRKKEGPIETLRKRQARNPDAYERELKGYSYCFDDHDQKANKNNEENKY